MPFDSNIISAFLGTKSVVLLIVSTGKGSNVLLTRAENVMNVTWVIFFSTASL